MSLAICLMVKDEAPYLAEFFAFHSLVGVSHFRVYDNGSTDGSLELLRRLSTHYDIEIHPWTVTGIERQQTAFNDACRALAGRFDWVAFLDADEFLFDPQHRLLPTLLDAMDEDVGAIAINQRVFGSAGLTEIADDDLVIRRFTRRGLDGYDEHFWVKTIARPECVQTFVFSHTALLKRGRYVMSDSGARETSGPHPGKAARVAAHGPVLHHYILKSWGEYQRKQRRGAVSDQGEMKRLTRDYFTERDKYVNGVEDTSLAAMAELVAARMRFAAAATAAPDGPGQALTPTDVTLGLHDLPAHDGFLGRDSANLYWVRDGALGRFSVVAARPAARLKLGIFMITEEYPLARMKLLVNGEPVEFALKHLGERWRILLSEAMPLRRGRNDIVLEVPEFLRISDVVPGAKDSRKMAIALTEICLVTQED
jgi:hypothetical protein